MSHQSMNHLILKEGHIYYQLEKIQIITDTFLHRFMIGDGNTFLRGSHLTNITRVQIILIKTINEYQENDPYITTDCYKILIEEMYSMDIVENMFTLNEIIKLWKAFKNINIDHIKYMTPVNLILEGPFTQVLIRLPTLQEYLIMNKLIPEEELKSINIPQSLQMLVNKYYSI